MQVTFISPISGESILFNNAKIADFLYEHLDEFGDEQEDILRAINYSLSTEKNAGGFVLVAHFEEEIVGSVVVNETGMKGYIPENVLVYIATHRKYRGEGIGKHLMEHAIKMCHGDIALHVEKNNPARFLYEKIGFTNPYLEMRYKRK